MREPTTIGLTNFTHKKLQRLKEEGYFAEMQDAYKFAIALALAYGQIAGQPKDSRQTIFNVGTLDPDKSLFDSVRALATVPDEPVYKTAERLAEWGVEEIDKEVRDGTTSIGELLLKAEKKVARKEK